jgi:hypothetical protein
MRYLRQAYLEVSRGIPGVVPTVDDFGFAFMNLDVTDDDFTSGNF